MLGCLVCPPASLCLQLAVVLYSYMDCWKPSHCGLGFPLCLLLALACRTCALFARIGQLADHACTPLWHSATQTAKSCVHNLVAFCYSDHQPQWGDVLGDTVWPAGWGLLVWYAMVGDIHLCEGIVSSSCVKHLSSKVILITYTAIPLGGEVLLPEHCYSLRQWVQLVGFCCPIRLHAQALTQHHVCDQQPYGLLA